MYAPERSDKEIEKAVYRVVGLRDRQRQRRRQRQRHRQNREGKIK